MTNTVHPIFRKENFSAAFSYHKLHLALQFATHFITVEEMQPFWYTLLIEQNVKRGQTTRESGRPQMFFKNPPPKVLTRAQTKATKHALNALKDAVTFDFGDDETCASTECTKFKAPAPFKGLSCIIRVSHSHVNNLGTSPEIHPLFGDPHLAVTLVHELAHGAMFVSRKKQTLGYDWFLHDASTSEIGFEGEARLFGGHCISIEAEVIPPNRTERRREGRDRVYEQRAGFLKWPSLRQVQIYSELGLDHESNDPEFYLALRDGYKMPDEDKRMLLSPDYFSDIFTDALCERVRDLGIRALQPETAGQYIVLFDPESEDPPESLTP